MLLSILFLNALHILGTSCNSHKNAAYCLICRIVINEAEWLISQVDPKKSIQVGSFRVDPKGNQKIKDRQYARSEVHIEEIIESVCEKLAMYGEVTFDNGTKQLVRTVGFSGQRLETKNYNIDFEKGNAWKYVCENFLEDHEEEIITFLQREKAQDHEKLICGEKLEICTLDDSWVPLFQLPEAEDEDINISDNENGGEKGEDGDKQDDAKTENAVEDDTESQASENADVKAEL